MAHHTFFGEFSCECGQSWKSENTYPDKKQICFTCKTWIFPKYLRPKTPYQGRYRAYGWFYCSDCDNEWTSHNSWANMGQVCYSCDDLIYPYRQVRPKCGKGNPKTPHFRKYCEMCWYLKKNCKNYNPDADTDTDTDTDSDDHASDYNDDDRYY
ncbi:PREDICTED: zinc finger CCHC domain-containing protein 24-like [Amphimedon queenslandica]|uniref:3CxxC-type domain-containing protein n=1 Tax=Amphimedon queenslandica TaxID=400682 RepID=A0A1X7V0L5_AMPQE|nr:PREDICTED: zinc finger CCHC domain-containing protein 24-like [Amphimedon queenslandica]|eukprot:XP_019851207.1 PREDICTED: zinc finger CCHC domain-containing protein 24-like [Amphimedon queenslandica]